MVVDESDCADHKGVGSDHRGADQAVANQVAESFGAVLVTLLRNESVKAAKQLVSMATPMRLRSPMTSRQQFTPRLLRALSNWRRCCYGFAARLGLE